MDELKYTIEIRHLSKYLVLLLLVLMIGIVIGSLYYFKGTNMYYIILVILFSLSYLFRKNIIDRPTELQLYERSLNFRYILGKNKFIYFKDIETVSVNSSNVFIMETKNERIRGNMILSDLSKVVAAIKNVNPKLIVDDKILLYSN